MTAIEYRKGSDAVRAAWFAYKDAGGHNIPAFVAGWNAAKAEKIDTTEITRFDEECGSYGGYFITVATEGDYVKFDDIVALLAKNGIAVKSFESIRQEKFEKDMEEKYGKDWR
jgi:hypothetical protein